MNDLLTWEGTLKLDLVTDQNILLDEPLPMLTTNLPLPNDYPDAFLGENNFELELIKAPLARSITPGGDPNILVGVSDSKFLTSHYDLDGQIINNLQLGLTTQSHGTGVVGTIAAKTNNGVGISSLAYNTKLFTASTNASASQLIDGLLQLSQQPGVRVVNCSWIICENNVTKADLDDVMAEVSSNGVLVIAGAGNGLGSTHCGGSTNGNGYAYPASYDEAISVTSVGSRYPIGYYHNIGFWDYSWKDCFHGRPDTFEGGQTHNDKVDVAAPGILTLGITDEFSQYPEGYRLAIGTSKATPFVTALAALIFSVNPALTPAEVKQIIEDTADDIYYIPYNQNLIGQLGTGRINAYRAVLTAKCMLEPNSSLDLSMQDSPADVFAEPNTLTQEPWASKDIWVRNQNDGRIIKEHQNPEYNTNSIKFVYVRVTNNSCITSSGTEQLNFYWSKAGTSLEWPLHWEGNLTMYDAVSNQDVLMGNIIGTITVPFLMPGEEAILELPWNNMPNPNNYININPEAWHFCLLARIISPNDPMTFPESNSIVENTLNNNNIAWKNVSIIEITPDLTKPIGGVVAVGNYSHYQKTYKLEFVNDLRQVGKPIYEESEVTVEMDSILYNAWLRGGAISQNLRATRQSNVKIVTGNNAILNNIVFDPNEVGTLNLEFYFLTRELTNKHKYLYHVVQRDKASNRVIGGETYDIQKKRFDKFFAEAGADKTIDKNESTILIANQINEDAIYRWYDVDDNLIYTGNNFTVSPEITTKYKLEIISNIDGFKDYDELQVNVNPWSLNSISPNPASNDINIHYTANGATSGYIMILNTNTAASDNYIIDVAQTTKTINVANYNTGTYSVVLICNGEVQDSKNLIKQ